MRTLQIAAPVLIALNGSLLFADQVSFTNGDRLTGTILKSDAKDLVIQTAVAGEIAVPWQKVQEIHSDPPLHVELADRTILASSVISTERNLEITTEAGAKLQMPKESVRALRNEAEETRYEKNKHFLHGWDGNLDAGLDVTRGNSDVRHFRVGFRAARLAVRDRLTLYASSIRSFDDLPTATPHTTADQTRGGAVISHDLISHVFAFANSDFMSDGLQDLNLRSVAGGGIGWHLVRGDRISFDVLGGLNFTREDYDEIQRNLLAGQAGEESKFKFGKNTSLIQNLAYFPDLTDPGGNYRTTFSLTTVTRIVKWFGWQNFVNDTFVSNPPAGKKQNEFVFTSGLRVAFSY